jgi:hypothetical protein
MTAEITKDASGAGTVSLEEAIRALLPGDDTSTGSFPLNYPPYGNIGTVNYQIDWTQSTADLQGFFDGTQVCEVTLTGTANSAPLDFEVSKGPITATINGTVSMDWGSRTLTIKGEATLRMGIIHLGTKAFGFVNSTWS